ncbi:MAG: hypothetical protein LBI85_01395 [Spirochaetaceae bacterium]|jgi:hypothetical protein|nr:hypothetical protein [Spirochaetaceae bacterium]
MIAMASSFQVILSITSLKGLVKRFRDRAFIDMGGDRNRDRAFSMAVKRIYSSL